MDRVAILIAVALLVKLAGQRILAEDYLNEILDWVEARCQGDAVALAVLADVRESAIGTTPPPEPVSSVLAMAVASKLSADKLVQDTTISAAERAPLIVLYPAWESDVAVQIGDLRRYGAALYRCVQAHTTQSDWTPPAVPALWTAIVEPGTIGEWVQPTGAQDAYRINDRVTHNGQTWVTTIDYNVWEPGVYGWSVY